MRPYYFDFAQQESPHPRAVAMARPIADHRLPASQPGGLIDALRAAVALIQLWHRRARERQQLACLDHRMLRDIGVTPAEAARECDKPFWRA